MSGSIGSVPDEDLANFLARSLHGAVISLEEVKRRGLVVPTDPAALDLVNHLIDWIGEEECRNSL